MLRRSEWVVVSFFTYTSICSLVMDVRPDITRVTLVLNVCVIGAQLLAAWAESLRHTRYLQVIRDWYPITLMLLAYREMGWFAPSTHTFELEQAWIVWDRLVLNDWGLRKAIELTGPVLPSILEISYSLVYTIAPFSMGWIYYRRKRERMDAFLFAFLSGIFLCYALFPFFPSEPPRTVFPDQDLPSVMTVFRRFNRGLLGTYGIHLSVFPSAHVAGAYSAAFAMRHLMPEDPWLWKVLLVLATSIATATFYGRYHYLVDALAGFAISLVAWYLAWRGSKRTAAG